MCSFRTIAFAAVVMGLVALNAACGSGGEEPIGVVTSEEARGALEQVDANTNVIVYLVDTLRARSVRPYHEEGVVSPHVAPFAEESLVVEQGVATSSWTRSAVASLLTGRWARSHGVNGREDALGEGAETLAGVVRDAGYETVAFVTNANVGPDVGFGQGFDRFRLLEEGERGGLHASGDVVNRAVAKWIGQRERERPFLLYVHTMEPHVPYAPGAR